MALPGSALYKEGIEKGIQMPKSYSGYSFHSYDAICLPTEKLEPWEILKLRDDAFLTITLIQNLIKKKIWHQSCG